MLQYNVFTVNNNKILIYKFASIIASLFASPSLSACTNVFLSTSINAFQSTDAFLFTDVDAFTFTGANDLFLFANVDTFLSIGANLSSSTGVANIFPFADGASISLFLSIISYVLQSTFVILRSPLSLIHFPNSLVVVIIKQTKSEFKKWLKTVNLNCKFINYTNNK